MLRTTTALLSLLLVAPACDKQNADTTPPEPAPAPAAPAVDPAIWEANDKDVAELGEIQPKIKDTATAATKGPAEAQAAINELTALAKEKGVKEKNVNRTVEGSLKKGKVRLRGVKKPDKEAMTTAVQKVLDNIDKLRSTPQTVADARAVIDSLVARVKELADAVRGRSQGIADGDEGADKQRAQEYIDHVGKVVEAVEKNAAAASGLLDELDKGATDLAGALNIELDTVKAADAAEGGEAKADAENADAGKADAKK